MSITLTRGQNACVGMAMGITEITLMQPMNYWKNARQQLLPMAWHPRVLYRGFIPSALNMSLLTMTQCAVAGQVKTWLTEGDIRALTPWEHVFSGFVGGVVSAPLIGSPLELLMTQQQRKGKSVMHHLRCMPVSQWTRGMVPTMVREGIWAMSYLSLPSILRPQLQRSFPQLFSSDTRAMIPTALLAAGFTCTLTQPFDTIKTCMQGDVERKEFGALCTTFRKLYRQAGLGRFYDGLVYRYGRMVIGVFLMDKVRMGLTRRLEVISV